MVNTCLKKGKKGKSTDDKLRDYNVDLNPIKIKQHGDLLVWHPTTVEIPFIPNITTKDYINGTQKNNIDNKYYESSELVQDPSTGLFIFVKKSEVYKYTKSNNIKEFS